MAIDNSLKKTKQLQQMLAGYQSGNGVHQEAEEPSTKITVDDNATEEEPQMQQPTMRQMLAPSLSGGLTGASVNTQQAIEQGFGTSRYDASYTPGMDIEHQRAIEQPGFAKVMAGVAKMGFTAGATFLNTVGGTLWGLGTGLWDIAFDVDKDGKNTFGEHLEAASNNFVSTKLIQLQDWSREAFPSYRTEQERTERFQSEWYKPKNWNANTISSFLENFGFTLGAIGAGKVASSLISRAVGRKLASDVLKGAVVAADGDAEATATLQRASEALSRGNLQVVDGLKLKENLINLSKRINFADFRTQTYSAVLAALGEGSAEGIMARNEVFDDMITSIDRKYQKELEAASEDIFSSNNSRWVVYYDELGNPLEEPELTEEGKLELLRRQRTLADNYSAEMQFATEQAREVASITQALNIPILTVSNLIQFSRIFRGGWNTNRRQLSENLRGGLIRNAEGSVVANYARKGLGKKSRALLGSMKVAATEGAEEMAQGFVSSGTKLNAKSRLTEFIDSGYDEQALDQARGLFGISLSTYDNMYRGGMEYLGDIKNWQEGALGALTGLLGIPSRRFKTWGGGIIGEYSSAKEAVTKADEMAAKLNETVNSKEFQDRWRSYIRHLKYQYEVDTALAEDDEYSWHTADDNMLINDIMMFSDAGRLNDLVDFVKSYSSMSLEQAEHLKQELGGDSESAPDWVRNASADEVADRVKENAKELLERINEYNEVYKALTARAPIGTSSDFLKELVFTTEQIKAMERRFVQMYDEMLGYLDPQIVLSSMYDKDGNFVTAGSQRAAKYEETRNLLEKALGQILPAKFSGAQRKAISAMLDAMEKSQEELGLEEGKHLVHDMRKIMEARQELYDKLRTLQGTTGEKQHTEQKTTPAKFEDDLAVAHAKQVEKEAVSADAIYEKYKQITDSKKRDEYLAEVAELADKGNAEAAKAVKLALKMKRFVSYMNEHRKVFEGPVPSPEYGVLYRSLYMHIKSKEDLDELVDNTKSANAILRIFTQEYFEYTKSLSNSFVPFTKDEYNKLIIRLQNDLKAFLEEDKKLGGTAEESAISATTTAAHPERKEKKEESKKEEERKNLEEGKNNTSPDPVAPVPSVPGAVPAEAKAEPEAQPKEAEPEAEPKPASTNPAPAPEPTLTGYTDKESGYEPIVETTEAAKENSADVATMQDNMPEALSAATVTDAEDADGKQLYVRSGVPEVDLEEFRKAKAGDKTADLSDKNSQDPEGQAIIDGLRERDAFHNVATDLKVGDEVEFVVDPNFPTYKGEYRILVRKKSDGKVLSIVPIDTQDSIFGLKDFKAEFDKEYREFIERNPNTEFVFSKTSTVWGIRGGALNVTIGEEKAIKDIREYDENAPIVFINQMGAVVQVHGKKLSAAEKDALTAFIDPRNLDSYIGRTFYVAKDASKQNGYSLIRLFATHFNENTKGDVNPSFDRVTEISKQIQDVLKELDESFAGKNVSENSDEVKEALEKYNQEKLRPLIQELGKILCLKDIFFELQYHDSMVSVSPDGKRTSGFVLRMQKAGEDSKFRRADQRVADALINYLAEHDLSVNISPKGNVEDFIAQGLLTANVEMMRPKNMDFYYNTWNPSTKQFEAMTPKQKDVTPITKHASSETIPPAVVDTPVSPEPAKAAPSKEESERLARVEAAKHLVQEYESEDEAGNVETYSLYDVRDNLAYYVKDGQVGMIAFSSAKEGPVFVIDVFRHAEETGDTWYISLFPSKAGIVGFSKEVLLALDRALSEIPAGAKVIFSGRMTAQDILELKTRFGKAGFEALSVKENIGLKTLDKKSLEELEEAGYVVESDNVAFPVYRKSVGNATASSSAAEQSTMQAEDDAATQEQSAAETTIAEEAQSQFTPEGKIELGKLAFDELPQDVRESLERAGWDADNYNLLTDDEKAAEIGCGQ